MTQEDKELLLKDLCARLPYGVKVYVKNWSNLSRKYYEGVYTVKSTHPSLNTVLACSNKCCIEVIVGYYDYYIKPYLFPLSSITDEQKYTCPIGVANLETFIKNESWTYLELTPDSILCFIDWLNKNHFDYRGLIEKDLAIDATELNIY